MRGRRARLVVYPLTIKSSLPAVSELCACDRFLDAVHSPMNWLGSSLGHAPSAVPTSSAVLYIVPRDCIATISITQKNSDFKVLDNSRPFPVA